MKSKLFTSLVMLLLSVSLSAQKTAVSGTVKDQVGPVVGASVIEKGTTNGTVTDLDGRFTINVAPGAKLVISSIGYTTQEIEVGNRNSFAILLADDNEFLDEVVVVGYGTMKKSDLSGASVSMKESDLRGSIITSLDQSLQGRAAGVSAVTTSGAPGSSSSIRVRGQATINANAEPLYVIDGVIMQNGSNSGANYGLGDALGNGATSTISPLSTINPADIVSMEILKDASATAIYGAQGANGVILITTKHGKSGEGKITYDGMFAVSRQTSRVDVMNLREYAEYYADFVEQGYTEQNDYYADPSLLGKGTNWQDEIFRTALQHQHQVSAQGGNDKVQYYLSGSYMNQEGTIIGSQFDRFSFRSNIDAQVKKWLKVGINATYANTNDDLKLADSNEGIIYYSLTSNPDIPVYDLDGNYAVIIRDGDNHKNPVAQAMSKDILLGRQKLAGNVYAEVKPFEHLTWRSEVGFDFNVSKAVTYQPKVPILKQEENSMSEQFNVGKYWQLKNYLTYANEWGRHNMTAMVGQECWESSWDYLSGRSSGLTSDEVHNVYLGESSSYKIGSGFGSSAMASFFTRWTYNYDDRYFATYTFRYDGSSNFGPDNRWAGFHSFAASWKFINEQFLKGQDVLSNGKIRVGWGQTGNANIGGYAWGSAISSRDSALGPGFRPANIANTGVHWEKQEQVNVGLDLGFFNNRLNFTADAYNKVSSDMLMSLQTPTYMGTQGNGSSNLAAPKGNYGTIRNYGLEITVDARPVQTQDFDWNSNFQISFNRNKLLALDGTANANLVGYGQWSDVVCTSKVGEPLYGFYGYKVAGIYTSLEDIENSPKPEKYPADGVYSRTTTVWPGDIKYEDVDKSGYINENDMTFIGSPLPIFTYGWTNSFRFKNIDFSVFFNGSYGNKVLNYNAMVLTHMNSTWTNQMRSVMDHAVLVPKNGIYSDYWYDDISNVVVKNADTKTPRVTYSDPNDNDRLSDRYIEDGSYLRLKNITLGYTFPKGMLQKANIETLRLYVNIQNLYTFTKYTGYDPEVGASTQDSTGLTFGVDNGRYPSPATFSCGLNITF